jgi:hypothetical protein
MERTHGSIFGTGVKCWKCEQVVDFLSVPRRDVADGDIEKSSSIQKLIWKRFRFPGY